MTARAFFLSLALVTFSASMASADIGNREIGLSPGCDRDCTAQSPCTPTARNPRAGDQAVGDATQRHRESRQELGRNRDACELRARRKERRRRALRASEPTMPAQEKTTRATTAPAAPSRPRRNARRSRTANGDLATSTDRKRARRRAPNRPDVAIAVARSCNKRARSSCLPTRPVSTTATATDVTATPRKAAPRLLFRARSTAIAAA